MTSYEGGEQQGAIREAERAFSAAEAGSVVVLHAAEVMAVRDLGFEVAAHARQVAAPEEITQ